MKKLALTIVCAVATGGMAFAQGTIAYTAISAASFTVQTNANFYSPLFGGGATTTSGQGKTATAHAGFYYELLYNTDFTEAQVAGVNAPSNSFSTMFNGAWWDAGLSATNTATIGLVVPINGNAGATVPWARPTTNNIVMVGWSSNLGTTWSVVSNVLANWTVDQGNFSGNSFFGVSATGWITPATGSPGATIFNNSPNVSGLPIGNALLTQLYLLPVPEPSTMVLVGLGGLSLLLFRRRK